MRRLVATTCKGSGEEPGGEMAHEAMEQSIIGRNKTLEKKWNNCDPPCQGEWFYHRLSIPWRPKLTRS